MVGRQHDVGVKSGWCQHKALRLPLGRPGNTDSHTDSDRYAHEHGYTYRNRYADPHPYIHADTHTDIHPYTDQHSYTYTDAHANTYPDKHADDHSHAGEGFSIVAPSSAVASGEYIGVRMYESGDASNVGMTHHRYTLGGSEYGISVVDSEGDSVSSYLLNTPAKVCVPLPRDLSSNISNVAILATNSDGSLTVLTSSVRISETGPQVCGNISQLPATVAAGKQGAPSAVPAPTPEPTPESPDTGGASPSAAAILWLVLLGVAVAAVSGFVVRGRRV